MHEPAKSLEGETPVQLTYDIFERLPDGQPLWVQAVASLEEARAQIVLLGQSRRRSAENFFVYDVRRGAEVATSRS
jgi:hypothetical protein